MTLSKSSIYFRSKCGESWPRRMFLVWMFDICPIFECLPHRKESRNGSRAKQYWRWIWRWLLHRLLLWMLRYCSGKIGNVLWYVKGVNSVFYWACFCMPKENIFPKYVKKNRTWKYILSFRSYLFYAVFLDTRPRARYSTNINCN